MNAIANAATRLQRFQMIYQERFPNMGVMAGQIEVKLKGCFIEVRALRESM